MELRDLAARGIEYVSVQLPDGTLRTERVSAPTLNSFLRDPRRLEHQMRAMAETLQISDLLFPKPIAEQIHRRDGLALYWYRGTHRARRFGRQHV